MEHDRGSRAGRSAAVTATLGDQMARARTPRYILFAR